MRIFLRMNERWFCGIFRSDFFFFFFEIVFPIIKFLGSKQAPRYTGKRVILMRVLTRLECTIFNAFGKAGKNPKSTALEADTLTTDSVANIS